MKPHSDEQLLEFLTGLFSHRRRGEGHRLVYERLWRRESWTEFETVRLTPEGRRVRIRISVAEPSVEPPADREPAPAHRTAPAAEPIASGRLLDLLQDFTLELKEASTEGEAFSLAVRRVCEHLGWEIGHVYRRSAGEGEEDVMEPMPVWYWRPRDGEAEAFKHRTMRTRFVLGAGLVGRVSATGEPLVIEDLGREPDWRRSDPETPGRSAAFFPVQVGRKVVAVLEFFSRRTITADPQMMQVLHNIGKQLGYFIKSIEVERWLGELAEEEQRVVGREVHDVLGQQIAALSLLGKSLHRRLEARSAPEAMNAADLVGAIEEAQRQVRRLAEGLVAAGGAGDLREALDQITHDCERLYEIECSLSYAQGVPERMGPAVAHLVRIAQEAIRNAVEHGHATRVDMDVHAEDDWLWLTIRDNGDGFPSGSPPDGGAGLTIMRQRAELIGGDLDVEEAPEGGVRVVCRVPRPQ